MRKEKWEFPVYWFPSKIEETRGGYRLTISMSYSNPSTRQYALRLSREPKASDLSWWISHWMIGRGPTA